MKLKKQAYNVRDIATMLGISLPNAYMLAARADFPAIRVSERRIIIPIAAFDNWLAGQTGK